jgi:hypothetical protein
VPAPLRQVHEGPWRIGRKIRALAVDNVLHELEIPSVWERILPGQNGVHRHPEPKDIHAEVVRFSVDHLWRLIAHRPEITGISVQKRPPGHGLRPTEVADLWLVIRVKKDMARG